MGEGAWHHPFSPRYRSSCLLPNAHTGPGEFRRVTKGDVAALAPETLGFLLLGQRPPPAHQLPPAQLLEQTDLPAMSSGALGGFPSSLLRGDVIRGESQSAGHRRPIWPRVLTISLENLAETVWSCDQPLSGKGTWSWAQRELGKWWGLLFPHLMLHWYH